MVLPRGIVSWHRSSLDGLSFQMNAGGSSNYYNARRRVATHFCVHSDIIGDAVGRGIVDVQNCYTEPWEFIDENVWANG